jgi:hypothetical protein
MIKGQCDCGAVAFTLPKVRESVTMCHCKQCRRMAGHFWASTHAPWDSLEFSNQSGLAWYRSSDWAKRGFCNRCGSTLFYRLNSEDGVGIAAGCLADPTGLKPGKHIFTKYKGDYYDIADDAPQIETY